MPSNDEVYNAWKNFIKKREASRPMKKKNDDSKDLEEEHDYQNE